MRLFSVEMCKEKKEKKIPEPTVGECGVSEKGDIQD